MRRPEAAYQDSDGMRFLLTNDDGYDAPGLAALATAAARLGEVVVLAPHEHVSGCGHCVTTTRPLDLVEVQSAWYRLDGSPADCARIGLTHLPMVLGGPFDWVFSGVNAGGNLGADVFGSGTVAAAREACLLGLPSLAISQYRRLADVNWCTATDWAEVVLRWVLDRPRVPRTFWNVNLPHLPEGAEKPEIVVCPLDPNPLPVQYETQAGRFQYCGRYHEREVHPGSDVATCFGGRIAATLMKIGQ